MNVLVSGWKQWGVLNTTTGEYRCVAEGKGQYYGLTYDSQRVYVGVHDDNGRRVPHIAVYDRALKPIEDLYSPYPLEEMHQVVAYQGKLYILVAGWDRVVIYDFHTRAWGVWHPVTASNRDDHHFNSIYFDVGGRVYLMAHKQPPRMGRKRALVGSEVLIYSPERTFLHRQPLGFGSHCIWRIGEEIFTLDSQAGRVISNKGFGAHVGGYLRGVVWTDDRRIIGNPPRIDVRDMRTDPDSTVDVFNADWELLASIPVPVGPIADLRAPWVEQDHAHPWARLEAAPCTDKTTKTT